MTPAEKQKLVNLEAAVRYLAQHAHGQAHGQVRDILARQPESTPEPERCCNLGTPGCVRAEHRHIQASCCCTGYAPIYDDGPCGNKAADGEQCGEPAENHRQPTVPEEPVPCPDGHVPEGCRVGIPGEEFWGCHHPTNRMHIQIAGDLREWNRGMRRG